MNRKLSETVQCGNLTTLYDSGARWGVRGQTVIYSALDKIQPQPLMHGLFDQWDSSKNLSGWLPNRTQRVRVNRVLLSRSWHRLVHQKGVFCPLLLVILYTNLCRSTLDSKTILKYVNNTVIVGLLHGSKTSHGFVVEHWSLISSSTYWQRHKCCLFLERRGFLLFF